MSSSPSVAYRLNVGSCLFDFCKSSHFLQLNKLKTFRVFVFSHFSPELTVKPRRSHDVNKQ